MSSDPVPYSADFGVYVHWPFCASKCPYCDFNSHVRESVDHKAWAEALVREIHHYAKLAPERRVNTIFFGGGTPSLMQPATVASVIEEVRSCWPGSNDIEITLEANPTSVEAGKFQAFREAGVNRVSIGVQSLVDQDLKFLGRMHSVQEAMQAIDIANKIFDRVSFDLIYARPNQDIKNWAQELEIALKLSSGHISLYQLTIEEGTPFHTQHARGDFSIPQDEVAGEFYEVTQEILGRAGMPAYEISNHAKPGEESRHNLVYWRYGDYVGIGPGAHGRLTVDGKKLATRGHRAPEVWLERAASQGQGGHDPEEVEGQQRWMEALMMGLRLREGVPLARLEAESGQDWQDLISPGKIKTLRDEGLLFEDALVLKATPAGLQRLNGVLSYLL